MFLFGVGTEPICFLFLFGGGLGPTSFRPKFRDRYVLGQTQWDRFVLGHNFRDRPILKRYLIGWISLGLCTSCPGPQVHIGVGRSPAVPLVHPFRGVAGSRLRAAPGGPPPGRWLGSPAPSRVFLGCVLVPWFCRLFTIRNKKHATFFVYILRRKRPCRQPSLTGQATT